MCFIYRFVVHLILIGLAFWALDVYLPANLPDFGLDLADRINVTPSNYFGYGMVALIFSFVNGILKPILKLLTFPLRLLTFGLFSFILNAGLLWLAQQILELLPLGVGMEISDWITYVVVGVIMAIITVVIP